MDTSSERLRSIVNLSLSICNRKYLGQQNSVAWHDLLGGEISSQYIEIISQQGAYKDLFVLQAIAEHFIVRILVVSTLNPGTTWIAPNGFGIFLLMPKICVGALYCISRRSLYFTGFHF